jgi:hypothetical protein
MTKAEYTGRLIFRYMRNELSDQESADLEAWRKLSPINESAFQEAIDPEKIRVDLKALEESRISRLAKTLVIYPAKKPLSVRRIGILIMKVAASVLFLFGTTTSVIIYRFVTSHKHTVRDTPDQLAAVLDFSDLLKDNIGFSRGFLMGFADLEIREGNNGLLIVAVPDTTRHAKDVYYRLFTSEGNRLQLNYADSTHIWLNSKATIKYPGWQKTDSLAIYISGEAYVHIPSGRKHVYEIKISPPVDSTTPSAFRDAIADKISRSIYLFSSGGDFYLKANYSEPTTTVALVSGSLEIDAVAGKSVTPVILQPGQQANLNSGNLQILKPEKLSDLFSWKNQ